jgi:hypothetical protein
MPWAKTPDHGPVKVGGLFSYFQSYGRITWLHDTSQAWVGLELDGTVTVRAGVPDIGAGQANSLCQIAAEVLGVPLERVSIYCTDSALTPLSGTSTATRQLYMSGNATLLAATNVRKVILDRASKHFEEEVENLDIHDSRVFVKSDPSQTMELPDLIKICAAEACSQPGPFQGAVLDPINMETRQGQVFRISYLELLQQGGCGYRTGESACKAAAVTMWPGVNRAAAEKDVVGGVQISATPDGRPDR